jgi:hypothetical protein
MAQYIYRAPLNSWALSGETQKEKARHPNREAQAPGSTADQRSMPSGLALREIEVPHALEAIDCFLNSYRGRFITGTLGYGLATAGT